MDGVSALREDLLVPLTRAFTGRLERCCRASSTVAVDAAAAAVGLGKAGTEPLRDGDTVFLAFEDSAEDFIS